MNIRWIVLASTLLTLTAIVFVQVRKSGETEPLNAYVVEATAGCISMGRSGLRHLQVHAIQAGCEEEFGSLAMAVAVLSHWFLGLIVHTLRLATGRRQYPQTGVRIVEQRRSDIWVGGASISWGLWLYLRSTKGETMVGRYGMIVYVVVLLLVNAFNIFGPLTDDSIAAGAITALVFYFLFAGIAYWLDGKRG